MTPTRANRSGVKGGPPPPDLTRAEARNRCNCGPARSRRPSGGLWRGGSGDTRARRSTAGGPVILVVIDTLRADRLPVYGYAAGRAPALTAFAREAVVFDRAYAHAPQTLPSHASMFTGRLPFEHKVRDNLGFALGEGTPTLAAMFRASGYKTGGFVSAFVLRPETGVGQGFDVYDATFPAMAADRSAAQVQRPGPQTLAAADAWLTLADVGPLLPFPAPLRAAQTVPAARSIRGSRRVRR